MNELVLNELYKAVEECNRLIMLLQQHKSDLDVCFQCEAAQEYQKRCDGQLSRVTAIHSMLLGLYDEVTSS